MMILCSATLLLVCVLPYAPEDRLTDAFPLRENLAARLVGLVVPCEKPQLKHAGEVGS